MPNEDIELDLEGSPAQLMISEVEGVRPEGGVITEVALVATDDFTEHAPYISADYASEQTVAIDEDGAELLNAPAIDDVSLDLHARANMDYAQIGELLRHLTVLKNNFKGRPVLVDTQIAKEMVFLLGHLNYLNQLDKGIIQPPQKRSLQNDATLSQEASGQNGSSAEVFTQTSAEVEVTGGSFLGDSESEEQLSNSQAIQSKPLSVDNVEDFSASETEVKKAYTSLYSLLPVSKDLVPRDPELQLAPALKLYDQIRDFIEKHLEAREAVAVTLQTLARDLASIHLTKPEILAFFGFLERYQKVEKGPFSGEEKFVALVQEVATWCEHFALITTRSLGLLAEITELDNKILAEGKDIRRMEVIPPAGNGKAEEAIRLGNVLFEIKEKLYTKFEKLEQIFNDYENIRAELARLTVELELMNSGNFDGGSSRFEVSSNLVEQTKARQSEAQALSNSVQIGVALGTIAMLLAEL